MPTVASGDASIYYEIGGTGPALVFAHGAGGNRLSWWQQTPHFERRFRVVRFDHRGFGRSHCDPDAFHPRFFAGDLLAILDAEGIERAALVCQSMGGWTGLRTALDHPDRVACLVLCDTPGGIYTERILEAASRVGRGAAESGIRGNAALAPDFPARDPARAHLYDQIAGLNAAFEPRWLARMLDESARIGPGQLVDYRVPTLVVAGAEDSLFPLDVLRHVAEIVPGARLEVFGGAGHSVYFEQPDAFNRAVEKFLDEFHRA